MNLNLCIFNGTVSAGACDGRDDFDFDSQFPFSGWRCHTPGGPRVGCACLNLLNSPELLQVLVTLAAVVGPLLPDFLGRAVVVLDFVGRFRGFVADKVP